MKPNCKNCPLKGQKQVPCKPAITKNTKLIIVGEGPGRNEVIEGEPFVGASGFLLNRALERFGLFREECFITNATLCRPPQDTKLTPKDWKLVLECCVGRLQDELKSVDCCNVLVLGGKALRSVTGKAKITPWMGAPLSSPPFTVLPCIHPAACLRKPSMIPVFYTWLQRACQMAVGGLPSWDWGEMIIHPTPQQILHVLDAKQPLGVDVETAGVDPMHAKLLCIGIANREYTISADWSDTSLHSAIYDVLASDLPKVMHNGQHDVLSLEANGLPVVNYTFDTLLAHATVAPQVAHDLGFVAAVEYSAPRWKSEFRVESDLKGGEMFTKRPAEELRLYNAKDANMTARLHDALASRLASTHCGADLFQQYMAMNEVAIKMRRIGMQVDTSRFAEHRENLNNAMTNIEVKYYSIISAMFNKKKEYKLGKNGQHPKLKNLFFKDLEQKPVRYSEVTGEPTLNAFTLEQYIASPEKKVSELARLVLDYRRYAKLLGTYIDGLPMDENAVVHSTWKCYGTLTGRWASQGPNMQNCFTGDTEILTESGWQRFDELQKDIRVAQYNTLSEAIEWVYPEEYTKTKARNLISVKNQHIDLLMTEDHRCLLQHRKTRKYKVVLAKDYAEDYRQLHGAELHSNRTFIFGGKSHLQLLVAIQADGHIMPGQQLDFTFTKKRKTERLEKILKECGLKYSKSIRKSGQDRIYVPLQSGTSSILMLLASNKTFMPCLLNLSKARRKEFLEEIYHWDGCLSRKSMYASKEKHNADFVCALHTLNGDRAKVRKYISNKGSVSWQVDTTYRNYSLTTNIKKQSIKYFNPIDVYCVAVPSTYIVVRRNGKTAITGNCPKKMRNLYIPRPGNKIVSADFSQLELRIFGYLSEDEKLIEWYENDEDVHTLNAQGMFGTKDITKNQRNMCKIFAYGLLYGGKPETIWSQMIVKFPGLQLAAVHKMYHMWHKVHPWTKQFQDKLLAIAHEKGYVEEPISGRREYFHDGMIEPNKVLNYPIQAAAGTFMNEAVLRVDKRINWENEFLITQVHDELNVEGPDKEKLGHILKEEMERPIELNGRNVSLPVDVEWGENWYDLQELKL